MLTLFIFLLVLIVGSGCAASSVRANLIRHQEATVRVIVKCDKHNEHQEYAGSGVIISKRRVLTAAHLVNVCQDADFSILTPQGLYPVVPIKVDTPNDLAILANVGPKEFNAPKVKFGPKPSRMSRIYVITGAPWEDVRDGILNHYSLKDGPRIKHSIVIERGNSGSGVYDWMGRLIGICTHATFCGNGQYCGGRASSLWDKKEWLK